jgi:hypothetical protein
MIKRVELQYIYILLLPSLVIAFGSLSDMDALTCIWRWLILCIWKCNFGFGLFSPACRFNRPLLVQLVRDLEYLHRDWLDSDRFLISCVLSPACLSIRLLGLFVGVTLLDDCD